ncbi:MAG: family N-acetyltransferase [Sphingomonas bacterium]|nr:family N-acetyltransferase [Sphingomonas bacterium]
MPVLTTTRLVLRPLVTSDADALHAIYGDEEAMRWWSHAPHDTLEQTRERVARNVAGPDFRVWAVTLRGDDRAIGTVNAMERRSGLIEIGYSLARAHWRRGLAGEAVTALIDLLFHQGARRLFADTDPDNAPSNRLLERLGFTLEGRLRGEWETHIGVRDSLIWGLLGDEWRAHSHSRGTVRATV